MQAVAFRSLLSELEAFWRAPLLEAVSLTRSVTLTLTLSVTLTLTLTLTWSLPTTVRGSRKPPCSRFDASRSAW